MPQPNQANRAFENGFHHAEQQLGRRTSQLAGRIKSIRPKQNRRRIRTALLRSMRIR